MTAIDLDRSEAALRTLRSAESADALVTRDDRLGGFVRDLFGGSHFAINPVITQVARHIQRAKTPAHTAPTLSLAVASTVVFPSPDAIAEVIFALEPHSELFDSVPLALAQTYLIEILGNCERPSQRRKLFLSLNDRSLENVALYSSLDAVNIREQVQFDLTFWRNEHYRGTNQQLKRLAKKDPELRRIVAAGNRWSMDVINDAHRWGINQKIALALVDPRTPTRIVDLCAKSSHRKMVSMAIGHPNISDAMLTEVVLRDDTYLQLQALQQLRLRSAKVNLRSTKAGVRLLNSEDLHILANVGSITTPDSRPKSFELADLEWIYSAHENHRVALSPHLQDWRDVMADVDTTPFPFPKHLDELARVEFGWTYGRRWPTRLAHNCLELDVHAFELDNCARGWRQDGRDGKAAGLAMLDEDGVAIYNTRIFIDDAGVLRHDGQVKGVSNLILDPPALIREVQQAVGALNAGPERFETFLRQCETNRNTVARRHRTEPGSMALTRGPI